MNQAVKEPEPVSFLEASQSEDWVTTMNKEVEALISNDTWEICAVPKGKKSIVCKWVYKVKLKKDGSIERYKVGLVAKGFTQNYGIDYKETLSPVVKMATVRCLIALAVTNE